MTDLRLVDRQGEQAAMLEGLLPYAQERDREDGAARHRQQLAILTRFRDRLDDALVSTANVDQAIAYHRAAIHTYDGEDA